MQLMILLALMQAPAKPDSVRFSSIYEKPFNDTLTLSLEAGWREANELELRVSLIDRRKPTQRREITRMRDRHVEMYGVLRADDSTIVIQRMGFYHSMRSAKLFLHPVNKYSVKQIDYDPDIGLRAVDDREVADVLGVPADIVRQLEQKPWEARHDSTHLPKQLRQHPMRHSTYAEFARARPARVKDGYEEEGTTVEEQPGPYQFVGTRIWFGKTFYDGEGHTGVGGLGYFDTKTGQYSFVNVPGLADWSVSAILIEEDAAWLGLVDYPEGEPYSGGLIRYDFKSRSSKKFPTEEVAYQIVRWKDRVYVATKNGAYLVQGNQLTNRYRVEPNIDNRFIIVNERLPSTKP